MKDNYIVQAWLILALAVCFAAALSGIEIALADRIEENKRNETYGQIGNLVRSPWWEEDPAKVWQADGKTEQWVTPEGHLAYKAFDKKGKDKDRRGWVIKASGQGFADKIEILIGLDVTGKRILGLYVLDQKETPALGNRIKEEAWRRKFVGRETTRDIVVSKASERAANVANNSVQAVTGATVSSESVAAIVNAAVKDFRNRVGDLKKKQ